MLEKVNFILTRNEKKKLIILFIGILLLAILETFSIGIIIPIMDLFINQEKIQTSKVLGWFYQLIGAKNNIGFLTVLVITAILLFVFKSLYTVFIQYKQRRVVNNINVRVTTGLLASYLNRPYSFHLENNSTILFRNVDNTVAHFSTSFLLSLIFISTDIVILLAISSLLFYLYPLVTLILASVLTTVMMFINNFFKKRVIIYASNRMEASGKVHKFGFEALHAIKEIKAYNVQDFFIKRYAQAAAKRLDNGVKFIVSNILPRYTLEIILWTSVLTTLLMSIYFGKNPSELIPIMTVFGLAALRVLPSIDKIYKNVNTVRFYSNSLDVVYQTLKEHSQEKILEKVVPRDIKIVSTPQESQAIHLENIEFRYQKAPAPIFKEFNLVIPEHKIIAFAGATGAGKSTLIDILMGLLIPANGALYYRGEIVTPENVLAYRRKISYVPQHIFLADDTLEANIAFGIPQDKFDSEQLKHVIQIVQLESLINDLPKGIKTIVGEKGVRLSGGQRQRLAIARALYRNPEILIMDEATSALDGYTEAELNKAIKNLYGNGRLTIILIAHRLSTIEGADVIYVMEQGKIVAQGSYRELLENSTTFKKIANQITA
ncbi:MAG: ABC transporter ATP-binding protein [Candidatus Omnitrophota bacterium]|nr:MAG: ABC transporter ATP-binding protein [Candidatus Omnitrophota bacterium]